MNIVYLINKQNKYCPENNNGDYIVEAYSTKELADKRCKVLDKEDKNNEHFVMEFALDCPELEYFKWKMEGK